MTTYVLHAKGWSLDLRLVGDTWRQVAKIHVDVHSLRRLRSALKAFRPVVDSAMLRGIDRQVRQLGRLVGDLRDADVLSIDIVEPVAARRNDGPEVQSLTMASAITLRAEARRERNSTW